MKALLKITSGPIAILAGIFLLYFGLNPEEGFYQFWMSIHPNWSSVGVDQTYPLLGGGITLIIIGGLLINALVWPGLMRVAGCVLLAGLSSFLIWAGLNPDLAGLGTDKLISAMFIMAGVLCLGMLLVVGVQYLRRRYGPETPVSESARLTAIQDALDREGGEWSGNAKRSLPPT